MSFEGYNQVLCANGHLSEFDVYAELEKCSYCGAKFIWSHIVDQTNDEGKRFKFKKISDDQYDVCLTCGTKKLITPAVYKIP
jgi:DNA-directed RNA polymerase subunit RPC12/RpoP